MREIRLEINQFWGIFFLNLDFEMQNPFILLLEFLITYWDHDTRLDVWRCVIFLGLDILCVLISHNIWCCVVIGIKESVCIIGLSWLQKVIREQIVSTKCEKPKVPCQYCQGINGGSRDVWKAYDWWEVYLFLCIILTIWMNFILISLNRVFAQ